jgi:hypothetical protein
MLTVHQFVMIIAAIRAFQSGIKDNHVSSFISIINLITEVIAQVFIAYKFPLLFVSLVIMGDPLFQDTIKYLYKKYKEDQVKNK